MEGFKLNKLKKLLEGKKIFLQGNSVYTVKSVISFDEDLNVLTFMDKENREVTIFYQSLIKIIYMEE